MKSNNWQHLRTKGYISHCLLTWDLTRDEQLISSWVNDHRYLGVFVSPTFKCSLDHARKSFDRSSNYIFGKVGRIASEEVIRQLISSKRIPVLLYSLEASLLTKSNLSAIDFVVNRFSIQLFRTIIYRLSKVANTVLIFNHRAYYGLNGLKIS